MTRDEIISEMGWSAIADCISKDDGLIIRIENIVRLAEAAEREACVKLVEPTEEHRRDASWGFLGGAEGVELCDEIAAAIRARSAP